MKHIHKSIRIAAPRELVWNTMLDLPTYMDWTALFHPGSTYQGSWELGEAIRFIGPMEDGTEMGMLGTVSAHVPLEEVAVSYDGFISGGKEDTTSPEAQAIKGSIERYRFRDEEGATILDIDLDTEDSFFDMMEKQWDLALARLKVLCEKPPRVEVTALVSASAEKVWEALTGPEHIKQWCHVSDDWEVGNAEHDVKPGGRLLTHMRAKDGSFGFDLTGTYIVVDPQKQLEYVMDDGRKVELVLMQQGDQVLVTETFDTETTNAVEMQRAGWQAILDNFASYTATL